MPERRRPIATPFEGVVYKINDWPGTTGKGCHSIYVKYPNGLSFGVLSCFGLDYREHWEFKGKVTPEELARIQEQMKCMEGPPKRKKRKVARPVEIRKDAVLQPNRDYLKSGAFEIYVRTKKAWFPIIRTTAKMAFYKGGRCSINNVDDIRRIE